CVMLPSVMRYNEPETREPQSSDELKWLPPDGPPSGRPSWCPTQPEITARDTRHSVADAFNVRE
ncbi:MAG: hypothetical protein R3336_00875, partial [Phycisphaeraceae bacterium]|nr:hypothetical protein [Phycisphaeraceae bacterium]